MLFFRWFGLTVDNTNPKVATAVLTLNDTVIDRELTDVGVDRVDLVLAARDRNVEPEWADESEVVQTLIIRITDINDNPRKYK